MLPEDPSALTDDQLADLLPRLTDEQLSDVLDRLEAAEVLNSNKTIDMGVSAEFYATRLRFPVFPLRARGKSPLTAHGFKDASCDPAVIRRWWQQWPDANIGTPTGHISQGGCGYDVLDVDGATGMQDWARIKHAACPPDCSADTFCDAPGPFDIRARVWTPGDGVKRGPGRHLFIPAAGETNKTRIHGLSIDYRGDGGYVVLPPSVGLSGVRYAWLTWPDAPAAASCDDDGSAA